MSKHTELLAKQAREHYLANRSETPKPRFLTREQLAEYVKNSKVHESWDYRLPEEYRA